MEELKKTKGVWAIRVREADSGRSAIIGYNKCKPYQGDTGHAQASMVTQIYAHVLDEDRKVNAQKFEKAFYAKPDLRNSHPSEEKQDVDVSALIEQLKSSPELAKALAALISEQKNNG